MAEKILVTQQRAPIQGCGGEKAPITLIKSVENRKDGEKRGGEILINKVKAKKCQSLKFVPQHTERHSLPAISQILKTHRIQAHVTSCHC